ncbi:ABC transporter substrate-binding protein [Roseisalinus antarcticus]|uniref:Glutathione-binding protein GsiB n=1 Tax=Roseisalinus antarcticus TaxID=254357 RepID=A0A1Y5TIN5_9RHOB|nr:ABC transporter substrate-binding protein [Roseisalinus antarcticus]SLN61258.1 Glutathione-binding protein GsiB precursor [Roseisalinus antarcticus]
MTDVSRPPTPRPFGARLLETAGALATAVVLALPGSAALAQDIVQGGDLRAALTGEPDVLDPATSSIYTGAQVYEGIFNKLIDIAPDGTFIPDLATSWEQTAPTTWTFTLRDDVTFHNGEAFTSADVKYSFERILDPATASAYAGLYTQIDSIDTPDPTTVVFNLKSTFGPFLTNMATNGQIVNQTAIETGDPARSPVGTGPFEFVEWVQGDHITVTRNEDYFKDDRPYLDSITFRFLPVDQSRITALSTGELDWVDAIPLQLVPSLSQDERFNYVTSPVAGIPDYLAMNTQVAPFDDVRVRQAVALAINREDIRAVAYLGTGELGLIEMPTGSKWYDDTGVFAAERDVEAARALLAEAGYPDGLSIEYLGLTQYPELLKTGQVVRESLKDIGIDMNIRAVEVSVWFDAFVSGGYQITSAYQERTIDPDNFYTLVLRSGAPVNTTGYVNPELDALIDEAAAATDMEERMALYRQVREIALTDAPLVFTHFETLNYLMNDNVAGSTITPTLSLHMEDVGFTE